jgi:prepilin-type N-terminal cleavage/methylation domain-containing protein
MKKSFHRSSPGQARAGFSLMELVVIIAIIAVLAAVSYPLMKTYRPALTAKGGARQIESLLYKAKLRATNLKKPVRAVINCARTGSFKNCFVDLQIAIFTGNTVTGWSSDLNDHQNLNSNLTIAKRLPGAPYDGSLSVPNIFWAVFLPSGEVFSDPKPMDLILYYENSSDSAKKGWNIVVNKSNGRAEITQYES